MSAPTSVTTRYVRSSPPIATAFVHRRPAEFCRKILQRVRPDLGKICRFGDGRCKVGDGRCSVGAWPRMREKMSCECRDPSKQNTPSPRYNLPYRRPERPWSILVLDSAQRCRHCSEMEHSAPISVLQATKGKLRPSIIVVGMLQSRSSA